ncbi:F-box protein-like protein [Tanacetum coccineum]
MSISRIHTPQLEDIPELIHRIQSLLPAKEAARTCILSKSWLHAWSTIPTLRFTPQFRKFVTDEQKRKYQKVIDHTLQRYHRDNISIESLDLELHIQNQELAFAAEKWIQHIVSKSCLKDLSLKIDCLIDSFTLPKELFSSENLSTIKLTTEIGKSRLRICSNPFIKCVTLRVLDLHYVNISEEVLHNLLSACTLLEKIKVWCCRGLKNVLVKNLRHLRELAISSVVLEINNVPSLCLFDYDAISWGSNKFVPFKIDSLGSVTQLSIKRVIVDEDALLDIIKSKFPLLERLELDISICELESLVITSASLKRLTLSIWENDRQVNVQVYAPKLLSFTYLGEEVHGLHFPTIAPRQIDLNYILSRPLDISFFLKLWEVLNSSSKFDIHIESPVAPSNIDVNDLRRRCPFPVTNMQKFKLRLCESTNVDIRFFDAFFSIFHPCYIMSPKLVVRKMMERQPTDLKDIELKNPYNRKWETLTTSLTSVLDALTDSDWVQCKLNWVSQ